MSSDAESVPKRIIIAPKPATIRRESVTTMPQVDHLVADAMSTLELELVKFRRKVNKGESLTLGEGKLLTLYIRSLIDMSKEQREWAKHDDLSGLSDEELSELLKKLTESKGQPKP